MQPKHNSQPTYNSSSPSLIQTSRRPPPRPAPRPEKYLKSQLSGWHSVPSFDPNDSTTNDSSLSLNQNLSGCGSDVSFSDEEADYEVERVCFYIYLIIFSIFFLSREKNYVNLSKKFMLRKKLM
jgi:hypothetical protein